MPLKRFCGVGFLKKSKSDGLIAIMEFIPPPKKSPQFIHYTLCQNESFPRPKSGAMTSFPFGSLLAPNTVPVSLDSVAIARTVQP